MTCNIVYHNSEEIVREIIQKIQNHEIIFFVGSAISFHKPSKLPSVSKIKEYTIRALCGKDQKSTLT